MSKKSNRNPNQTRNTVRRVTKPSATSNVITNRGALQSLRIKHRELVLDITGDNTGNIHLPSIPLNPGLETSFPWLSAIANRFETYQFHNFRVLYTPSVGTTAEGSISIAPDYDATDPDSTLTRKKILSFEDAVRGPLWQTFRMTSTRRNLYKRKTYFTRHAENPTGTDRKLYDFGELQVWVVSDPSYDGRPLGELWFEYDVTFHTPQMEYTVDQELAYTPTTASYNDGSVLAQEFNVVGGNELVTYWPNGGLNWLSMNKPGYFAVNTHINSETGFTGPGGDLVAVLNALVTPLDREVVLDELRDYTLVKVSDFVSKHYPGLVSFANVTGLSTGGNYDGAHVDVIQLTKEMYEALKNLHPFQRTAFKGEVVKTKKTETRSRNARHTFERAKEIALERSQKIVSARLDKQPKRENVLKPKVKWSTAK